jgi:phytoene dehydrogenase-like protein
VHPLAVASPFFAGTDLAARGVTLLTPKVAFAHPLDGGRAAAAHGTVDETASDLGGDAAAYRALIGPLVREAGSIVPALLAPLRSVPDHPVAVAGFMLHGLLPATILARRFKSQEARAMLAGVAAHSIQPMTAPLSGGFGLLMMTLAHSAGWPVVEGGSARIINALIAELESLGGQVVTGTWIRQLDELPPARAVLLDVTPRQFLDLAGAALPPGYARALRRFRYGPGVCKVDWALAGPVPWDAQACPGHRDGASRRHLRGDRPQ